MARSISAPVGINRTNLPPDVITIQILLNKARAAKNEPPIKVDGNCGPKTVAAIQKFQLENFGWAGADGRINPGRQTLQRLNQFDDVSVLEDNQDGISCNLPPAMSPRFEMFSKQSFISPRAKAQAQVPLALLWVSNARIAVNDVRNRFARIFNSDTSTEKDQEDLRNLEANKAMKAHFHHDRLEPPRDTVDDVLQFLDRIAITYAMINIPLVQSETLFIDAPAPAKNPKAFATAPFGLNNLAKERIRFHPELLILGPLMTTAVIIHECAHFVDLNIGHFASAEPPPDGAVTPVENEIRTKNYAQLNGFEAEKNANSYAQFAVHIAHGFDFRFTKFSQ